MKYWNDGSLLVQVLGLLVVFWFSDVIIEYH